MALISDYGSLQSEIADWSHRSDLATKIPTFIQLAESKISNNIKSRMLEVSTTLLTTAGVNSVALPSDYGSFKTLLVNGSYNSVLTLLPDTTFLQYSSNNSTGLPKYYCIQGTDLLLSPTPDSEYSITAVYYQNLLALSGTNATNWVLTKYPYIYLYGSLIELSVYINDPEQLQFYQAKFDDAVSDMWENFTNESFSGSRLVAQSDYIVDFFQ
jgi:hypothetical protein